MNYIWLFLILSSIIIGAINGRLEAVNAAMLSSAQLAVDIALSLIGIMALWLGVVKIAQEAGLIEFIAKLLQPITNILFNEVPKKDKSLGLIAMNFSANALGIANAATPIGLKAMKELQKLNPKKDTASNSMCTFLAINTAGFQLVPATAIAILAATGSSNPTEIIIPSIIATSITLTTAIIAVKILERFSK